MSKILFDSSVWIAYIDERDIFHEKAKRLVSLHIKDEIIIFDVIINEVLSVVARRLQEKQMKKEFSSFTTKYLQAISGLEMVWIYENIKDFFHRAVDLMIDTDGLLGFNDALIVYGMMENEIFKIATFDNDFKLIDTISVIN